MSENLEIQQLPKDWKRSVFIPIPKKGNGKKCSNYQTIALISYASKVVFKFSKPGFTSTWTMNFQMSKLDLEDTDSGLLGRAVGFLMPSSTEMAIKCLSSLGSCCWFSGPSPLFLFLPGLLLVFGFLSLAAVRQFFFLAQHLRFAHCCFVWNVISFWAHLSRSQTHLQGPF